MSENKDLSGLFGRGVLAVAVLAAIAAAGYFSGYWLGSEPDDSVPLTVAEPDSSTAEPPSPESDPAEAETAEADTAESETTQEAPPETAPATAQSTQTAEEAAPEADPATATEADAVESTEDDTVTAANPPAQSDTSVDTPHRPDPPSIDTFRLENDGRMLISGRTQPGWVTQILLDGAAIATVEPDGSGQFASFMDIDPSDQARVLSLSMRPAEGGEAIASLDEIIIAPAPRVVAEAATGTAEPTGEDEVASQDTQDTQEAITEAPAPSGSEVAETQSQTVLLADETGVTVLQAPQAETDAAPEETVALDAITYSEEGNVQISGRASSDAHVRLYLDNEPVVTSQVTEDGSWKSDLPEVDAGNYTLRIDEVDSEGNVTSRVETPFKREGDIVLAEVRTAGNKTQITAVTVVPGSTLWAISRAAYGDGVLFVRVFEANKDRIRDPDLIYPGQVFTIPQ